MEGDVKYPIRQEIISAHTAEGWQLVGECLESGRNGVEQRVAKGFEVKLAEDPENPGRFLCFEKKTPEVLAVDPDLPRLGLDDVPALVALFGRREHRIIQPPSPEDARAVEDARLERTFELLVNHTGLLADMTLFLPPMCPREIFLLAQEMKGLLEPHVHTRLSPIVGKKFPMEECPRSNALLQLELGYAYGLLAEFSNGMEYGSESERLLQTACKTLDEFGGLPIDKIVSLLRKGTLDYFKAASFALAHGDEWMSRSVRDPANSAAEKFRESAELAKDYNPFHQSQALLMLVKAYALLGDHVRVTSTLDSLEALLAKADGFRNQQIAAELAHLRHATDCLKQPSEPFIPGIPIAILYEIQAALGRGPLVKRVALP